MKDAIKKYIDVTDKQYHTTYKKDEIESIVEYSYTHFNRAFKKIIGMTPDKYRIRRQLYLIILEIKESGGKINGSKLGPWGDETSFCKAFKREFNISHTKYIKNEGGILQEKIDVEYFINLERTINDLKTENKTYEEALKYLISLPYYEYSEKIKDNNLGSDKEFFKAVLENHHRYNNMSINEILHKEVYKKYIDILYTYYNEHDYVKIEKNSISAHTSMYFMVNKSLLKRLISLIDVEKFFDKIDISSLKTISSGRDKSLIYVFNRPLIGDFTIKPFSSKISDLDIRILERGILADCDLVENRSINMYKNYIYYNENKRKYTVTEDEIINESELKKHLLNLISEGLIKL